MPSIDPVVNWYDCRSLDSVLFSVFKLDRAWIFRHKNRSAVMLNCPFKLRRGHFKTEHYKIILLTTTKNFRQNSISKQSVIQPKNIVCFFQRPQQISESNANTVDAQADGIFGWYSFILIKHWSNCIVYPHIHSIKAIINLSHNRKYFTHFTRYWMDIKDT